MCKKVNLSLSTEVDSFLTQTKRETGLPKSQVISYIVARYGEKAVKDLQKYKRKEQSSSMM